MAEPHSEWRGGWPVVLGAIGGMMTVAAPSALTGMVMAPLQQDFGWSRAQVTLSIMITAICALVFAPVAGTLINRYGVRAVALIGFTSTALGFTAVAFSGPSIWGWFGAWVIYGTMSIALGPVLWSTALSSLFDRHRGFAISIALSGSGFAFSVWPPIVAPLIADYNWRAAYVLLAVICVAVMLPLNFFALRALGRREAADTARRGPAVAPVIWGPTLGEALRSLLFWRITAIFILAAAVSGSLMIHFYPILTELRLSASEAAYLTAMMGPAIIVGRIGTGWLMDRLFAPYVAAVAMMLPAGSLLILMLLPSPGPIMAAAILEGLSVGAMTGALAYLTGRYFGLRHYASIFGVLIGIFGICMGLIPSLTGHYFDVVGSYVPLFPFMLAGTLPIGLLLVTLGRYPDPRAAD